MPRLGGPHWEAAGSVRRQGEREQPWAKAFFVVPTEGTGEAGETGLGLAS